MTRARGATLFLIVGPSGAGKDTLIAASRKYLSATHAFARRVITRSHETATEDHMVETVKSFATQEREGRFVLSWRAHGLHYGIPASIVQTLEAGTHVVANVSRDVVDYARQYLSPVRVILVTAPVDVLSSRLALRGRETPADIAERLARHREIIADRTIINDGQLETALNEFIDALRS